MGLRARLPRAVVGALYAVIRTLFLSTCDTNSNHQQPLQDAVSAQRQVGIHMMIRGFVSTQWETAMDELGVPQPDRKADTLLCLMWEEILTPLWKM